MRTVKNKVILFFYHLLQTIRQQVDILKNLCQEVEDLFIPIEVMENQKIIEFRVVNNVL